MQVFISFTSIMFTSVCITGIVLVFSFLCIQNMPDLSTHLEKESPAAHFYLKMTFGAQDKYVYQCEL